MLPTSSWTVSQCSRICIDAFRLRGFYQKILVEAMPCLVDPSCEVIYCELIYKVWDFCQF